MGYLLNSFVFATPAPPITSIVVHLDASNTSSYPGTGTIWYDLSGNNYNGNLTNGPTYNSGNGGYIVFDGSNDFVDVPLPATGSYNDFSYSLWIYPTVLSSYKTFIDQGNDKWYFGTLGTEIISYNPAFSTGYSLSVNQWYFINMTHTTGGPVKFYVNGSLIYTSTNNSTILSTNRFGIGAGVNSPTSADEFYSGRIAEVLIHNGELSLSDIQTKFNNTKSKYGL
jgi:hypothetical protein